MQPMITNRTNTYPPPSKTAWVLRHVAFEDLGILENLLQERGFFIRYLEAGVDNLTAIDPLAPNLLVVLGGPIGVYEQEQYPYLQTEIDWIRRRVLEKQPTLGICLGAQLIASALGAKVYPGPLKELGWGPITLTPQGQTTYMKHLVEYDVPVLHWHGDAFDLPENTIPLASSTHYPQQAFSYGNHRVLAMLFHPEVDPVSIERWFIGHAVEIAKTPGVDVRALRADSQKYGTKSIERGEVFFCSWLDAVFSWR